MLKTKFMPPSSAGQVVRRPRLLARTSDIARTKIALVRAAAGFGKTTLLAQWYQELRDSDRPVAWLSFDASDRDANDVLAYITAAIESAGHVFGPSVRSITAPDSFASPGVVVDELASDLCTLGEPLYLFLDDLHVLNGTPSGATLASFIERSPDSLHVILASREVPDIPLARARALGNVFELTASDLRFSKAETAEFMALARGTTLDAADIDILDDRVEGWVAGLKLAGIALDGDAGTTAVLESLSGRRRTFAEFFIEVVIGPAPTELGTFLLQTAVLDRLCPALCEAVTGSPGARDFLDTIESRGLFIFSLDAERRWYRYHHLFAEFLRAEYARRDPDGARAVHARASRWLSAAGLHADAFGHAIHANDYVMAADILDDRCHTMFYSGQLRVLLDFASQIPDAVLAHYPRVQLAKAWSLILEWKFSQARAILASVRATLAARPPGASTESREDMLYLHCTMMLAQFEDDMPTVERRCANLLERFMDADPYLVGTYYTSLLYAEREQFKLLNFERLDACAKDYFVIAGSRFVFVWHQSIAGPTRFLAGDTSGALETLRDGLDAAIAISGRNSGLAAIPALLLAEVHYERNELDLARELLDRYLPLADELGFVDQLVAGYVTQARLHRIDSDERAAQRVLGRGMELAHSRGFRRLELNIVAEGVTHALATGQLERVARLADVHDLRVPADAVLPKSGSTTHAEARAIAWTGLARAEGRLDDVLRVGKRWQRFAVVSGAIRSQVRWGTILAQTLAAQGDALGADRVLRAALTVAAPGRFVRTFLDLGPGLSALLDPSRSQDGVTGDADDFHEEVARLALGDDYGRARAGPAEPGALVFSEPLSGRELEIVKLVATGMSNRDIAERLGMTEGTVKWHLHRIFDKVGARRRTQVVHCARRSGLIA